TANGTLNVPVGGTDVKNRFTPFEDKSRWLIADGQKREGYLVKRISSESLRDTRCEIPFDGLRVVSLPDHERRETGSGQHRRFSLCYDERIMTYGLGGRRADG
ncbi:MAG: hypothetical protein ACREIL_02430, partial [Nitrospiraceae bacterium]